ncbi:DUF4046 domain-containing protein [Clostridium sp.]|uniref:DUF4046 domain-containing protein n=1 Tax=Clostridium sp. TaxID=1506 RepID=UPI003216D83D
MDYKGVNLTNLDDCEIYDFVLKNEIPNFPLGYWRSVSEDEGTRIALQLLKYIIETKLNLSRDQMLNSISKKFILANKL